MGAMGRKLDIITLIVLILEFISWLVFMAATAALDAEGMSASALGYTWWAVWFQFFLLVFVGLTACMGSANANRLRTYLMLMVTVVIMQVANDARVQLDVADGLRPVSGDVKTDLRAVLAGTILSLIFNFVLIIYWGLTEHSTQALSLGRGAAAEAPAPEAPKAVEVPTVTTV
ncbi:hypothetical protein COHA_000234 [Chlorella ohadii]|uniref:Uncharacterized protein n=1 Tax=Chlorella ohadii TaxID=2649997 RepID=A0AAD5E398_9CHLO|nr:hypothetical protein COHA_000234 [Chlorella ohadii]